MNKLIYTSYSPNTRFKDLILNIKLLIQPSKYLCGEYEEKVNKFFKFAYKDSIETYTFNYARSGMYVLLKSLGLSGVTEVLVTGFTCTAAVNPVMWCGLKIKYVDIDKTSGNMSIDDLKDKISNQTKVVIFQHTFGNSKGIEDVKRICNENNLILIEDCTNTVLGKHNDKLIGEFGDFAIFSFGRDKAVSGVSGGLILINSNKYAYEFEKLYKSLTLPPRMWVFKELLYPIFWEMIKKTLNIKIGKLIHLVSTKLGLLTKASTELEKDGIRPSYIPAKLPNSLACLALNQLKDIQEFNQHRLEINGIYFKMLANLRDVKFFEHQKENVLLRFPLLVNNKIDLLKYLKSQNILVGDWFSEPITPHAGNLQVFGYTFGMCPNSEKVCLQIINLPNHINIKQKDALKIVSAIKGFYGI